MDSGEAIAYTQLQEGAFYAPYILEGEYFRIWHSSFLNTHWLPMVFNLGWLIFFTYSFSFYRSGGDYVFFLISSTVVSHCSILPISTDVIHVGFYSTLIGCATLYVRDSYYYFNITFKTYVAMCFLAMFLGSAWLGSRDYYYPLIASTFLYSLIYSLFIVPRDALVMQDKRSYGLFVAIIGAALLVLPWINPKQEEFRQNTILRETIQHIWIKDKQIEATIVKLWPGQHGAAWEKEWASSVIEPLSDLQSMVDAMQLPKHSMYLEHAILLRQYIALRVDEAHFLQKHHDGRTANNQVAKNYRTELAKIAAALESISYTSNLKH
jgi:hypothetical protein